jgi:hypothetical protein
MYYSASTSILFWHLPLHFRGRRPRQPIPHTCLMQPTPQLAPSPALYPIRQPSSKDLELSRLICRNPLTLFISGPSYAIATFFIQPCIRLRPDFKVVILIRGSLFPHRGISNNLPRFPLAVIQHGKLFAGCMRSVCFIIPRVGTFLLREGCLLADYRQNFHRRLYDSTRSEDPYARLQILTRSKTPQERVHVTSPHG